MGSPKGRVSRHVRGKKQAARALLTGHQWCHRGASNAGAEGRTNDLREGRVSGATTVAR